MKLAAISGYAGSDYLVRLPSALQGPQTATIETLGGSAWPRPGGAALYVARHLSAAGHHAAPLIAVGDDTNGRSYLDAVDAYGIDATGMRVVKDARTPWCMLLYHDDGDYTCLIDRGTVKQQALNDAQRTLIRAADYVCIAAGDAEVSTRVLDELPQTTPLAWIAKRDSDCFPTALGRRLAQRADIIFCNSSERPQVDSARFEAHRAHQIVIETRGASGVAIECDGDIQRVDVEPMQVRDATGAGDTLAGGVIASLLAGECSIEAAVREGVRAARRLLQGRTT